MMLRSVLVLLMILGLVPAWAGEQARPDAEMRALLRDAITRAESFRDRFEAEVWLTDMGNRLARRWRRIPLRERVHILRAVHREATAAGLPPELVLAVIEVESGFDRFALSSAGARGLMQVMPFWVDEIGRPEDNLFDIDTNLRYGCAILKLYLEREHGDLGRALARYNGSIGKRWYPDRVFTALRERWFRQ
ncbi:MAG TPA: lytic transglycosylase domain-containing protein [Thiotrichales bacterium]|nr:lytic transglycosylase domain-containing protein [Thiotrichales bacterium]